MTDFEKIESFIKKHHIITLATSGSGGGLWCAHVFYVWMPQERGFVFTTETTTRHGAEMEANPRVAAGIALETRTVGRIQGLQIEGLVHKIPSGDSADPSASPFPLSLEKAHQAYLKKYPYGALVDLSLWFLEPVSMKLTDNTLGFGKKLKWAK